MVGSFSECSTRITVISKCYRPLYSSCADWLVVRNNINDERWSIRTVIVGGVRLVIGMVLTHYDIENI